MECPCCDKELTVKAINAKYLGIIGVRECSHCGAVFGQCYKGDSYRVVLPQWHAGETTPEDLFYYDLSVVGSAGLERRHGWAHKTTRRIVQTG